MSHDSLAYATASDIDCVHMSVITSYMADSLLQRYQCRVNNASTKCSYFFHLSRQATQGG